VGIDEKLVTPSVRSAVVAPHAHLLQHVIEENVLTGETAWIETLEHLCAYLAPWPPHVTPKPSAGRAELIGETFVDLPPLPDRLSVEAVLAQR
jgi:hypothetical protein